MKKFAFIAAMMMACAVYAKDLRVLVVDTQKQMHCQNCEAKIKKNIRFEKGVKAIETSVPKQTVTITYDADKGSKESIVKALGDLGYQVKVVGEKKVEQKKAKK